MNQSSSDMLALPPGGEGPALQEQRACCLPSQRIGQPSAVNLQSPGVEGSRLQSRGVLLRCVICVCDKRWLSG